MTQLFEGLLEKAKTRKDLMVMLKNAAVKGQQFELAVKLKEMEAEFFPPTPEQAEAKQEGSDVKTLLSMVEIKTNEEMAWLLSQTFKKWRAVGDKFTLLDAAALLAKKALLFQDITIENQD